MQVVLALTLAMGVVANTNANPLVDFGRQLADASCSSLEDGVDYVGNDIATAATTSAADCCAKCAAKTGCGAFTWTNYNGGTCWLKSSKGSTVATTGAKSAVLGAVATCSVEANVDYVGNDIGNVYGASASDCCAKCSGYTGCGAYSWTNYNGGTCWLKSSKGATKANSGVYSAVVSSSSAGSCPTVEQGIDYVGNDMDNTVGSGAADCCTKCAATSGCKAFTWSDYMGGTCWLKSGKGATKSVAGVVSAVVTRGSTPTPTTPTPTTTTTPSTHIMPRLRSGEIPLRAVNLGGWLVGEYWMSMSSPAWKNAGDAAWTGEYGTMQKLGKDVGTQQFEQHRATWITETDIIQIAAAGLNSVRVPVGFWIVDDINGTVASDVSKVYAPGALKYLDKLLNEWAVTHNIAVMLSLHAHQGSQNGYDHSAPQFLQQKTWSLSRANVDSSLQLATALAARYKDSAAFLGLNLMNEPDYPINMDVVLEYYKEAYRRIRATGNNCVLGVSPPIPQQGPPHFMDLMRYPEYDNVWHEFHVYYRWGYESTSKQFILDTAQQYRGTHLDSWSGNWILMGEWSLTTPDQIPFTTREELATFAAIQLKQFQGAHSGWAFWSWRHDEERAKISPWSLRQLLKEGVITVPRV